MLYELWRQVARNRGGDLALQEFASGRRWTFRELAAEAHSSGSRGNEPQISFPQGNDAEFILAILRAWRESRIVCPLELGQAPPLSGQDALPRVRADQQVSPTTMFTTGIVHLKTTSATTGASRLIAFTAEQIATDAENVVSTMGLRAEWPNLGVISLAHSYGFSNLVTPLLLHGIPLILAPAPLPETIRQAAKLAEHITLPAVPAMWRAWHDANAIPPNVELAISAGAPLPLALEREIFTKHGLKIHNFYGASECGGIAYDASETPRTDAACVGTPMKNTSLSVVEDGCLKVRSPAVAETYWPHPGQNLGGGCFRTSDLAEISGGLVYLRGRTSDQINIAGRKVSPETIERALLQHPQVSECLVFGVPSLDAKRTEEIVAVVVCAPVFGAAPIISPTPGNQARGEGRVEEQQHSLPGGLHEKITSSPQPSPHKEEREFSFGEREEALHRFMLEALPAWQAPRHWWFVESLAVNERGKVSRAEWRIQFNRKRAKCV